jgi:4-amino-4-deoxy-L-arabinose transferase-like glycosyltransferase
MGGAMATSDNLLASNLRLAALRIFSRRYITLGLCSLFFLLALVIRLYNLGAQSLWLDEGGTWAEITSRGWPALLADLWNAKAAYPFYHLLLKAWVGVAGDSEWALRFPSALAGAGAVVAIYLAATELRRRPTTDSTPPHPFIAAILLTTSPFALWYAQDAKVYSLLILVVALELWALLRAFRRNDRRAWRLVFIVAVVSLFVHRLALLAAAGVALAYLIVWPADERRSPPNGISRFAFHVSRTVFGAVTLVLVAGGVVGLIIGVSGESQGTGGHIPAGPLQGLWLSLAHFGADRGDIAGMLGLPLVAWMLPCIALMLWGLALLVRDAARRDPAATAVLCLLAVPLALLTAALAVMPVYEARYATVAFPAWILVLAYPFVRPSPLAHRGISMFVFRPSSFVSSLLLGGLFLVNAMVLFQPKHGLFSGAPVKEQWREAIGELAHQAHPDDLIILHPYFVAPLWGYYTPRVTPDPLPQPVTFPIFAGGFCSEAYADPVAVRECIRREYNEPIFNEKALGKKRMLLLIAPDHANIVDPPINPPHDKFGWVGLRFQYPQHTWPCGGSGDRYIGVEIMCQSFPDTYNASGSGTIPRPAVELSATFGGELRLRGYSLDLHGGAARPGGALPVTLYWEATAAPTRDYTMFLHLCRDCTVPPLAQDDSMPLDGYFPAGRTTTWIVGDPVHDERAITLPANLPAGRYTLLLGVYPSGDPSDGARLPVVSDDGQVFGGTRLVLGEVVVTK